MAGLDDLDPTTPAGSSTPRDGDNEIRAVKSKVKEYSDKEHYGSGEHKILSGTSAQRPAHGKAGRLYILAEPGVPKEIQRDTGTGWETLTSNADLLAYIDDLAAHMAAGVLDHPDGSVTSIKILAGAILKKHLMGGTSTASIAALVDGSNADAFHSHVLIVPDNSITNIKMANHAAGDLLLQSNDIERAFTNTGYTVKKKIKLSRGGTYRVKFDLKTSGSLSVWARIYKNGVAIGTEQSVTGWDSGVYWPKAEDIAGWAAGDELQLYVRSESGGNTGYIQNLRLYVQTLETPYNTLE